MLLYYKPEVGCSYITDLKNSIQDLSFFLSNSVSVITNSLKYCILQEFIKTSFYRGFCHHVVGPPINATPLQYIT